MKLTTAHWPDALERPTPPVTLALHGWALDGLQVPAMPFEPAELGLGVHPYPTGRGGHFDLFDPRCWVVSCLKSGLPVTLALTRERAMDLACACAA